MSVQKSLCLGAKNVDDFHPKGWKAPDKVRNK